MNHKRTIIALAAILMAIVPVGIIMSDGSDASMDLGKIWGEGFTNTSDGTLFVTLKNTEYSDQEITIVVTSDSGRELARATVTVPANSTYTAELRFGLGLGSHDLTVTCTPAILFVPPDSPINYDTVNLNVTESLWSKPTNNGAIIAVALLIVIAFYLRMRNAPATKPDTTFTELERQKESKTETAETPRASATERRRYRGSEEPPKEAKKPVAKPPEPPAEKKAASFTELEKQKSEKKETAPKKESSSEEPKKLKYVSSRRK